MSTNLEKLLSALSLVDSFRETAQRASDFKEQKAQRASEQKAQRASEQKAQRASDFKEQKASKNEDITRKVLQDSKLSKEDLLDNNLREEILNRIKKEKNKIAFRNWEQKPENKEKRRAYFRKYKKDRKITCECGKTVLMHNLCTHKKTQFHNKYLEHQKAQQTNI